MVELVGRESGYFVAKRGKTIENRGARPVSMKMTSELVWLVASARRRAREATSTCDLQVESRRGL